MDIAQKITKRQNKTLTWAASSIVSEEIEASGAITQIDLLIALTASGSMAAAEQEDGIWRIIQSLTIRGSKSTDYVNFGDEQIGRMIHLLNLRDGLVKGRQPLATVNYLMFKLHFGSRPLNEYGRENPFDMSAFLPAFDDSGLKLEWGTTANDVMDDTVTISSAIAYVTVHEVVGTRQALYNEMKAQRVPLPYDLNASRAAGRRIPSPGMWGWVPMSSYNKFAHDAAYSGGSKEFNLPTGNFLRRIAIMVQDETATRPLRADDEVTDVRLKLPNAAQELVKNDWRSMVLAEATLQSDLVDDNAATGGALAAGGGFACIDLRDHYDPDLGLDARAFKASDFKLGVSIATPTAGDDSFYYYDGLRPYEL